MTLDEAIKIKLAWRKENYPPPLADEFNADALSIEALKRIKAIRKAGLSIVSHLFQGETEE